MSNSLLGYLKICTSYIIHFAPLYEHYQCFSFRDVNTTLTFRVHLNIKYFATVFRFMYLLNVSLISRHGNPRICDPMDLQHAELPYHLLKLLRKPCPLKSLYVYNPKILSHFSAFYNVSSSHQMKS